MLIEAIKYIGIFYFWTWIVWPFVFVFSLAFGIVDLIKDDKASLKPLFLAGLSLLIMLSAVMSVTL